MSYLSGSGTSFPRQTFVERVFAAFPNARWGFFAAMRNQPKKISANCYRTHCHRLTRPTDMNEPRHVSRWMILGFESSWFCSSVCRSLPNCDRVEQLTQYTLMQDVPRAAMARMFQVNDGTRRGVDCRLYPWNFEDCGYLSRGCSGL